MECNSPQPKHCQTLLDFVDDYDIVLLDCDGVLYSGPRMLGKSFETVKWLEAKGKKVFFITNSSGKTRADFI